MQDPSGYKPPSLDNPYEQIVRVFTALLSILIGFSLKDLLAPTRFGGEWSSPALAFVSILFLVVRFLTGSANYLWIESLDRSARGNTRKSASWIFTWHLVCLITFGLLAIRLCHSTEIKEFLGWNVVFGLTAALVSGFNMIGNKIAGKKSFFKLSPPWFLINIVQAGFFYVFWSWNVDRMEEMCSIKYNVALLLAAVVSAAGLILDLQFQVWGLEDLASGPNVKEAPHTGKEADTDEKATIPPTA